MTSAELKLNEIFDQEGSRWESWQMSLHKRVAHQYSKWWIKKCDRNLTKNSYQLMLALICVDEEEVGRQ